MAAFQPIHFIPKSRREHILSQPIMQIIAAPHHQDAGTNHWCFYLATSPGSSVQLDCLPSYSAPSTVLEGGSKANLIISELESMTPADVERTFSLDITRVRTITVKDRLGFFMDNGRHQYEFDSNGVGCRFWVTEQIELPYEVDIVIDRAQVETVKKAIIKLWPEQTPLALDRGAYYT